MKLPIAVLSANTELLIKYLIALKPNEQITYEQMHKLLPNCDLRGKQAYILQSARRVALNTYNIATLAVHGVGIKRATDGELSQLGEGFRKRIHRAAKKLGRQVTCADFSKLTNDEKTTANYSLSMAGALALFTTRKQRDLLAAKVQQAGNKLAAVEVLALPAVPEGLFGTK